MTQAGTLLMHVFDTSVIGISPARRDATAQGLAQGLAQGRPAPRFRGGGMAAGQRPRSHRTLYPNEAGTLDTRHLG